MSNPSTTRPVALVTGASRGIGAATARELAWRGYALALAARSIGPLATLAGELTRAGAPAVPIPADLARLEDARRLARIALEQFGRVDVLVNNAGIGSAGKPVVKLSDAQVYDLLATNLLAPIELTRALLPGMLERRRGAIIFVASVAGHVGVPGSALYSASKFGLRGFAEALRRECRGRGVDVTIVSPGFIRTEMTADLRIPMPGPEGVARAIADAIDRPQREVIIPGFYRLAVWVNQCAPWLVDAVLPRRRR